MPTSLYSYLLPSSTADTQTERSNINALDELKSLTTMIHLDYKQILVAISMIAFIWLFQRYIVKPAFRKINKFLAKRDSHFHIHMFESYEQAVCHALILSSIFASTFMALGLSIRHEILTNSLKSILIFYFFLGVYRLLHFYAQHPTELSLARKSTTDSPLLPLFCQFSKYFVMFFAFAFVSFVWGFDLSGLVAGLGIGGLAIALGAKDVLSNMFGGMAVALDKPFSKGDWISTQDRKIEGLVEEVNFRSTKILTFDKAIIYVPNTVLANQPIVNWTRRDVRRVKFQLAIDPATNESNIRKAIDRILITLKTYEGVEHVRDDEDENIHVFIDELTEAGFMLKIIYFTNTDEFKQAMHTKQEMNFAISRILDEECVRLTPAMQQLQWNRVV